MKKFQSTYGSGLFGSLTETESLPIFVFCNDSITLKFYSESVDYASSLTDERHLRGHLKCSMSLLNCSQYTVPLFTMTGIASLFFMTVSD